MSDLFPGVLCRFSIQMNVVSVDRLIDLCHKMTKIEVFDFKNTN